MKRMIWAVAMVAGLVAVGGTLAMQGQTPQDATPTPPPAAAGTGAGGGQMMLNAMAQKLGLTDDQKAKIGPILADRRQKLEALRDDTSTPKMKKGREMKSILDESDKKINAVLTKDQQKQYAAMEEQMKEQAKARRQGGGTD